MMPSKKYVNAIIESAEDSFLHCLATLRKIKECTAEAREIIDFQPRLASSLRGLEVLAHEVTRERKKLIEKKQFRPSNLFKRRLFLLDSYLQALKVSAERGRMLGDNFAWLFYCREELLVAEHMKLGPGSPISSGVGGLAEVNFIKEFPLIEGRFFLLYHGITTFLRIGDVSLVDMRTFRLAGLGELKSGPMDSGRVEVSLAIIGARKFLEVLRVDDVEGGNVFSQVHSPERFKRQLERIVNAVTTQFPEERQHARLSVDYSGFSGTLEKALSSGFSFQRFGRSLAVAIIALPHASRYSQFERSLPQGLLDRLTAMLGQVAQLASEPKEDNAIWISKFSLRYLPGSTPNFWTAIPTDLAEGVFQERIAVVTIYNPACFIRRLREIGFEVKFAQGEELISVTRVVDKRKIDIENIGYYLSLIQEYFVDELSVADCIGNLVERELLEHSEESFVVNCIPMQVHSVNTRLDPDV
jgi:hypothetical protein